ncbi:EamA family transporter [Subtercola boreus]|uniref:EamA family transporter n=2 Tax=Subtercola boreus TaxID=120213 RepID=A0A3E0VMX2_9MICO|nr:DMT family transporter [Subtercola boreus]RFA11292.1 EamA family transporter [Subtercola boreus]TQL52605.1 threonine/homoserine efflux transporter RhtA [Subtercola boreus]
MAKTSTSKGLAVAILAAATFGASGAFIKPLLEAGWSPAAAVTVRALIGGIVLLPFALLSLRGRWAALWRGRWRVLAMALVGVAGTQLVYFAAIQRIPVGTGILIEYMAPLLLVASVWAISRRRPKVVVLVGSVIALVGLVLVVSPGGGGAMDALGIVFALIAMVGCALYYVIAARPADGLPAVALAGFGLLLGGLVLGAVGLTGAVPFTASFGEVGLLGGSAPWWIPLLIVGVISTAIAYAASIAASGMLGSRLASFVGLLEVVAATFYAWLLLGEALSAAQLVGGALILVGIGFVRSEKRAAEPLAPGADGDPDASFDAEQFAKA